MIREIDSSEDPGKLLSQAMQIPIFTEFADECLRIVEPHDESEMVHWSAWLLIFERNKPALIPGNTIYMVIQVQLYNKAINVFLDLFIRMYVRI